MSAELLRPLQGLALSEKADLSQHVQSLTGGYNVVKVNISWNNVKVLALLNVGWRLRFVSNLEVIYSLHTYNLPLKFTLPRAFTVGCEKEKDSHLDCVCSNAE